MKKNWLGKLSLKLLILFVLGTICFISSTGSFYNDVEVADNNTFSAGTLDFSLRSDEANFVPDPNQLYPASVATRSAYLNNTGSLSLQYQAEFEKVAGDDSLCSLLNLQVSLGLDVLYSGVLADFAGFSTPLILDPGIEDHLLLTVSLPAGADPSYSGKTCYFNLNFFGWQTNLANNTSGFTDVEVLTGNQLGTADFESPPAPVLYQYAVDEVVNSAGLIQCWQIVTDPQDLSNPVTYEYQAYSNSDYASGLIEENTYTEAANKESCGGYGLAIVKHAEGAPEGDVYWQVRAVDSVGNASAWSQGHFLIDNTAPTTSISVSNSPAREITDLVDNGSFEDVVDDGGVDKPVDWDYVGDVEVVEDEFGVFPKDGDKMVKIGLTMDPGNDLYLNSISQVIDNQSKNISFWYNFMTYDIEDWDEPGFAVFINDQMVYQIWAKDVDTGIGGTDPDSSGWKQFLFDLSSIDNSVNPTLTLVFFAGNTSPTGIGDDMNQSWVYLDLVSTENVVVNQDAVFTLDPSDNLSNPISYYQIGDSSPEVEGDSFFLDDQPNGDVVYYWSVDEAGNEELPHKSLSVIYDDDKPDPIDDLAVTDYGDGSFTLDFIAVDPNDTVTDNDTAASYLVKYSTDPIENDDDFDLADQATVSASPRPAGEDDSLEITGLVPGITYYFAIKAMDAAPNLSDLDALGGSVISNGPTVVLNEFLPDPSGPDNDPKPAGEWIELYNNALYDIDVNGWVLYDSDDSHELVITSANTNSGNTTITGGGFLVVYRNGDVDFDLDNDEGDSLRLYNGHILDGAILIDSYTYTQAVTTDKSFARSPDGTGSWFDPLATPGGPNTLEQGNYVLGQHEPDDLLSDNKDPDNQANDNLGDLDLETKEGSSSGLKEPEQKIQEPEPSPSFSPSPSPLIEEPGLDLDLDVNDINNQKEADEEMV